MSSMCKFHVENEEPCQVIYYFEMYIGIHSFHCILYVTLIVYRQRNFSIMLMKYFLFYIPNIFIANNYEIYRYIHHSDCPLKHERYIWVMVRPKWTSLTFCGILNLHQNDSYVIYWSIKFAILFDGTLWALQPVHI